LHALGVIKSVGQELVVLNVYPSQNGSMGALSTKRSSITPPAAESGNKADPTHWQAVLK
jgi:hypothetical protein